MGDIDKQTVAGAIATATHGSGIKLGSLSSVVRAVRIVTGTGELLDIDAGSPERLRAVQTALGTLGVITRVVFDVAPRYWLREHVEVRPVEEVLDDWASGVPTERHWQFFYAPAESSYRLYDLPPFPKDHCWVKTLREVDVDDEAEPIVGEHGSRTGRSYLIYPDTADEVATWVEMEYMVDARDSKDAFVTLRDMVLRRFPEAVSPIQLRWIRGEEAYLSPMHGRDRGFRTFVTIATLLQPRPMGSSGEHRGDLVGGVRRCRFSVAAGRGLQPGGHRSTGISGGWA
jgi:hypothetical protein